VKVEGIWLINNGPEVQLPYELPELLTTEPGEGDIEDGL
jgi:hypothetical protein